MPTYDFTKGAGAIDHRSFGKMFREKINIKVSEIIASNATLTANAKITAADVIQLWDIPADVVLLPGACLETVTAGSAGNTGDIGIAGGDEMFDGVSLAATAGTLQVNLVGDDWGVNSVTAKSFTATDTLDMVFVADEIVGEWNLYVIGYVID